MRTRKAFMNIMAGGLGTLLVGILQFIGRMVFIRFLSDEYLGISSLFTNILSILSLAELGIGNAICFGLYKPLAEGDRDKIKSLMHFFRKAYGIIGFVVLGIGLLLLPFLPWLMTGTTDLVDVRLIYVLYVLQSAASYWFWAYKSILLQADQKLYVVKACHVAANLIVTALQIVSLCVFGDFLIYSVIGLMANVLMNLLVAGIVDRHYPYLREKDRRSLKKEEKKEIFKDVFGMSLFKMNTTVVNSTDNIVISAFINVRTVALYGNYQTVISGISQVAMQLFGGVTASVGNLFAEGEEKRSEFIFRCLQLLCYWLYGFVGIGIFVLINPVIRLCFGAQRVFGAQLVLLQVIYFVINGFQRTSFIYRDACGLFWKGKARPAATAILNIAISVVLVRYIGLAGVILGTIISWLLTTWWYDPVMIYRNVFHMPVWSYFGGYLKAMLLTVGLGALTVWISELLPFGGMAAFAVRLLLVLCIPNLGYLAVYGRSEEYRYLKEQARKLVHK